MSEYLLQQYRPIAGALLSRHALSVPARTTDLLAHTIMKSRVVQRDSSGVSRSPTPAKEKAKTHARALLAYVDKPPSRQSSIATRCASLSKALGSPLLGMEIGIAHADGGATFDWGALLDALDAGRFDPTAVTALLRTLEDTPVGDWKAVGRPWGRAKYVVRAGCIAWKRAGRVERYSWREDQEGDAAGKNGGGRLAGPLPDFLRELIGCCNGTHQLVSELERMRRPTPPKGSSFRWPKAQGDGLTLSDKHLQLAIMDCKNDGLL